MVLIMDSLVECLMIEDGNVTEHVEAPRKCSIAVNKDNKKIIEESLSIILMKTVLFYFKGMYPYVGSQLLF